MRYYRFLISGLCINIALFFCLSADSRHLLRQIMNQDMSWIAMILTGFFMIQFLIVAYRLLLFYRQMGYVLTYREAYRAILSGQISNLFFLPFLGTMLGQKLILSHKNIPPAMIAWSVLYERVMSGVIGAIIALGSAFLLYRPLLTLSQAGIRCLVEIGLVILLVGIILCLHGLIFFEKRQLKKIISFKIASQTVLLGAVSLIGWGIIIMGFSTGVSCLYPDIPWVSLMGAGAITAFIASLPITVNGWGLRELATIKIFGILGVSVDHAFLISVAIGICSMIALFGMSVVQMLFNRGES